MPTRTRWSRVVQLLVLLATAALGAAWSGGATAAPAAPAWSVTPAGGTAGVAVTAPSWHHSSPALTALPPPHDPDRGSCAATRVGQQIRLDCVIKVEDTTLWVACSGGFVEIRHLNPPGVTAQGTCPIYGGYALTATSPD